MCLLDGYKKLGYIVFMDNFYIGSDLFHNWLINEKTAACGTMQPRRGVPKELTPTKFKQQVEYKVMSITINWLEWDFLIESMSLYYQLHMVVGLQTLVGNTGKQRKQYPNPKLFMFRTSSWVTYTWMNNFWNKLFSGCSLKQWKKSVLLFSEWWIVIVYKA